MEFSVKKFDLLGELNLTQGVVERKTTIPILSHLLLEAKGNRLTITATDLELSVRTSCEAKVKKEGAGTIPAKKLLELVRLLPEGEIRFKLLENHWVQITSDRTKLQDGWHGQGQFPCRAGVSPRAREDPGQDSFFADRQNGLCHLHGRVALHAERRITASSSPRPSPWWPPTGIAWPSPRRTTNSRGFPMKSRTLVPKKAMTEIQRLAAETGEDGQIEFARDESHLFFQVGPRLLISRILTGQFPNYEAVLPRDNTKTIVLERGEFNDAVRRVSQLADQRSHA